jgi:DNA-binding beta-propeller fold protein YncE
MKRILLLLTLVASLLSCKKDPPPAGNVYGSGVWIVNEGPFMGGTGTLSHYDRLSKIVRHDVFAFENDDEPLGNILQSITIAGADILMVVNNSQRVVVADHFSMKKKGELIGLSSPRYAAVVNGKAYVSDWTSNTVAVFSMSDYSLIKKIDVGTGPEGMFVKGTKLWVANGGGFGIDSTVSIIDLLGDTLFYTLVVDHNPHSFAQDIDGHLWVLCSGYNDWSDPANSTAGALWQFHTSSLAVVRRLMFTETDKHPVHLKSDAIGEYIYCLDNNYSASVVRKRTLDDLLPSSAHISGSFYGLGLDPLTGELYTADPLDYNQNGIIIRHQSNGTPLDTIEGGIIPSNFAFN